MDSIVQFVFVRWKKLLVVIIGSLRSDLNPKYFAVSKLAHPFEGSNCLAKV
jgi:hypothetical protein